MYVGIGIFMLVLGAILRYAISANIAGINLNVIGNILMIGGIIAILASIAVGIMSRQRHASTTRTVGYDPSTGERVDRTDYERD